VYECQVTRYDHETREWCLFADYRHVSEIESRVELLTDWVRSPTDEELYIESLWKSEVIRVDSMKANAAKRGLAKLTTQRGEN